MREVFLLAYHLHWAPESSLDMPIPDRREMLRLLVEQLEMEQQQMGRKG